MRPPSPVTSVFLLVSEENSLATGDIHDETDLQGVATTMSHIIRRSMLYCSLAWPDSTLTERESLTPVNHHRAFCSSIVLSVQ